MKKALFAGSFDPPSLGHLDIILRASKLVDKLVIGVAENGAKGAPMFSIKERMDMLAEITKDIPNVRVVSFTGLIVDYARNEQIDSLIRGLRPFSDHENEFCMAIANRKMGAIETLFLPSDDKFAHISSSIIRDVAYNGGDLDLFVPGSIQKAIEKKLKSKAHP